MNCPRPPDKIRAILAARPPVRIADPAGGLRRAGVLMPLFTQNGRLMLLLTKRSRQVAYHKGQLSFPGGTIDSGDHSSLAAALREAEEEIGLKVEDVEVLGALDDARTLTSPFVIRAFVGYFRFPYPFRINPAEVDRLMAVPLATLLGGAPGVKGDEHTVGGRRYQTPAYRVAGEVIWGATGRMIENLGEILGDNLACVTESDGL